MNIPKTYRAATLSFWLHVDTAELASTGVNNLDAEGGYVLKAFDLRAYIGRSVQIYLFGAENAPEDKPLLS